MKLKRLLIVKAAVLECSGIGAIVSVFGTLSDLMKNGWAVVGIYLLFPLDYASILFQKKK